MQAQWDGPPAVLMLADGFRLDGISAGATAEAGGDVIFHTTMTAYQEVLTDPARHGQVVAFTHPHVGNCGVNDRDSESNRIWAKAAVMADIAPRPSNWRATGDMREWLRESGVVAVSGIDTRALIRHLRANGPKKGIVSAVDFDQASLLAKAKALPDSTGSNLAGETVQSGRRTIPGRNSESRRVAVLDCGIRRSIADLLCADGEELMIFSSDTPPVGVMAASPAGLFISDGPGDPAGCRSAIETVRSLLGKLPIFAEGLGMQILALALGGKTKHMKLGHHGGNYPVREDGCLRILMTSQDHDYIADIDGLSGIKATHVNLNDGSLEGFRCTDVPAFAIQFRPESGMPGVQDPFKQFRVMMNARGTNA